MCYTQALTFLVCMHTHQFPFQPCERMLITHCRCAHGHDPRDNLVQKYEMCPPCRAMIASKAAKLHAERRRQGWTERGQYA